MKTFFRTLATIIFLLVMSMTAYTVSLDFGTTSGLWGIEHQPTYIIGSISLVAAVLFVKANYDLLFRNVRLDAPTRKKAKIMYASLPFVILIALLVAMYRTF